MRFLLVVIIGGALCLLVDEDILGIKHNEGPASVALHKTSYGMVGYIAALASIADRKAKKNSSLGLMPLD